jgi:hypothetical protein
MVGGMKIVNVIPKEVGEILRYATDDNILDILARRSLFSMGVRFYVNTWASYPLIPRSYNPVIALYYTQNRRATIMTSRIKTQILDDIERL